MRTHELISSVTRGDSDAASRRALGRLGGMMFMMTAVTLAATLPLLDAGLSPEVPRAFAGVCLVTGLVMMRLPWDRWPREVLALQSVLALVLFVVAARLAPAAYPHYLPLYPAILLYVGITQRLPIVFGLAALMVATYCAATVGIENAARPFDFGVTFGLGLASAVAQSTVVERYRRATTNVDLVLRTTRELGDATDVRETLAVLETTAAAILDADLVVTFLAEEVNSDVYVATSSTVALPMVTVDITDDTSDTVRRLRRGEQVFVADAADPRLASSQLVRLTGTRSMLHIPLTGENDRLGAVVAGWLTPRRSVDQFAARTAGIIVNEAGRMLARQREDARMRREAQTDPLTGLLNRRAFDTRLRLLEPDDTVMVIDLDFFKDVNDRHGHAAGDRALRTLAACMLDAAHVDDCAARMGGDELVMVLRHGGRRGGRLVAEQLRDAWAQTVPPTTLSIGIAVHVPGEMPATTVDRADRALYEAKRTGRDCFVIHDGRIPAREPG